MHIVARFPPTDREAAAEVGYEETNDVVGDEVMGNASMACVVCSEHDLVLEDVNVNHSGDTDRTHPEES